jgi:hypothetical protein
MSQLNQTTNIFTPTLLRPKPEQLMPVAKLIEQEIPLIVAIFAGLRPGLSYTRMDRTQPKAFLATTFA